jgi:NTP pyrophosphatase (non-canonical NTP hydrolase)
MTDLADLQSRIIAFRDEREWEQFHNPKDLAISLLLEASEFLEHFQWRSPEEMKKHLATRQNEVNEELVDVLYWVLLIAHDLKIDIPKEFDRKMKQNEAKYPVEKAKNRHTKYTEL